MTSSEERTATLPTPRVVGRTVRIVLGTLLVVTVVQTVKSAPAFLQVQPGWSVPGGDWWVAAIACLFVLPRRVNSGFGLRRGEWVRVVYTLPLVAAVGWDRALYGRMWGTPLAVLVLALILYTFAHAGISFIVSAIAATPG